MLSVESTEYAIPACAGHTIAVVCNYQISSFITDGLEMQSPLISTVSDMKDQKNRSESRTAGVARSDANSSDVLLVDTHAVGCLDSPTPSAAQALFWTKRVQSYCGELEAYGIIPLKLGH